MRFLLAGLARHPVAIINVLLGLTLVGCTIMLPDAIKRQTIGSLRVYVADVSLHHTPGSPGGEPDAVALQKVKETMSDALRSAGYDVSTVETGSDLVLRLKGDGGVYGFGVPGVVELTLAAQRGGSDVATARFSSRESCGEVCPLPRTASILVNKLTEALAAKTSASAPAAAASAQPEPTPTLPPERAATSAPGPTLQQKGVVAVLPIDTSQSQIEPAAKMAFEENIRSIAGDTLAPLGYTILTGETTLALLSDNNVQTDKICDASCALSAAREMKAKLFVSGVMAKTEGEFVAFVRLFESKSGRQLASVRLEGDTVRSLRKAFETKAPDFFAKANGQ